MVHQLGLKQGQNEAEEADAEGQKSYAGVNFFSVRLTKLCLENVAKGNNSFATNHLKPLREKAIFFPIVDIRFFRKYRSWREFLPNLILVWQCQILLFIYIYNIYIHGHWIFLDIKYSSWSHVLLSALQAGGLFWSCWPALLSIHNPTLKIQTRSLTQFVHCWLVMLTQIVKRGILFW